MVIDLPLPSWRPDNPDLSNPGLTTARNVIPSLGPVQGQVTYQPINRGQVFAESSMESRPRGVVIGSDSIGVNKVYAGSAKALYRFSEFNNNWVNASRTSSPYATTSDERWNFIRFGSAIIGTNYTDFPQFISLDGGTNFDNLTTLCKGRHIAQHRGFVMMANTWDPLDGFVTNRIRWSALENPTDWNFNPGTTQADFQDVQDVGEINGIVVDEDIWLLCKTAIVRMHYVGTPWIYEFTNVVNGKGCAFAQSVVTVDGTTYFLGDDGFYRFNKGNLEQIGVGLVDNFFLGIFNTGLAGQMTAVADPKKTLIYWTFASNAASNGRPDTTLIYNYISGDWSIATATVPYLYSAVTLAWTIDRLTTVYGTISNMPAPFDSPLWAGGNSIIWGMDHTGRVFTLTGEPLTAILETAEYQLAKTQNTRQDRATVLGTRPIFETGGVAKMSVGSRSLSNGNVSWTDPVAVTPETGFAYHRNQDRYHRFRIELSGRWDRASMLQVDFIPAGGR
jgi:hypothetical protein